MKNTKKALLTSALCLLLCFSMLIGTTFAWFTDEVKSGNNIIKAGNLDVELYHKDGAVTGEPEKVDGNTVLFDDVTLWEPGAVAYEILTVKNVGNLALKYQLGVNITDANFVEDADGNPHSLAEVLKVAVVDAALLTDRDAAIAAGEDKWTALASFTEIGKLYPAGTEDMNSEATYGIVIYWQPGENDNLFNLNNGKTTTDGATEMKITLGVGLYATQLNHENDSFGPDYDEDAWVDGFGVYSEQDLNAAINNGKTNIVLMDNITLTEAVEIPAPATSTYSLRSNINYITIDLNGKSITTADPTKTYAFNNLGNLILKDSVGGGSVNARGIYNGYDVDGNYVTTANLIVESGIYNAMGTDGGAAIFNYGVVTINGGTFTSVGGYSLNNRNAMTINDAVVTGGIYNTGALIINDGSIKTDRGGYMHAIYSNGGSVEVNGGSFSGNGNEVINANSDVAIINGGTFQKVEKTSYLLAGSNMVINGGTFLAHESNPAAHPVRPDVTVKGGTFNYKHTNIAEGYKIVENNGMYIVVNENAVTTTEELVAAINEGKTEIELAPGNFTWPTSYNGSGVNGLQGKTLTIKGTRNAVIDTSAVNMNDQYVTGANLTFEGVTLNFGTVNYMGFANTASLTYKDCAVNGLQFVCGNGTVEFVDCDLNSNGAEHSLWTWGISNISFTGCDFTYADRAINCYAEYGQTNATFTGCTFTKVEGADTTGAIETNSSTMTALNLTINNCTVNEGDLWWVSTWDGKAGANTFATVDGKVASSASMIAAIKNGATEIELAPGSYTMPIGSDISLQGKTLTIKGTKDSVIDVSKVDERDQYVTGATLKFEGVTLNFGTALYMGFANCTSLTYENCVINGVQHLYGPEVNFVNCVLNATGDYMVRTWGGQNVNFSGCTFNCDGKALLVYNQSCNLTVENCVFNDNGDGTISGKAAIEVCNGDNGDNCVTHNIVITNTTVNGFDVNPNGISTNSTLWANKNSLDNDHLNVTIDGVVVY